MTSTAAPIPMNSPAARAMTPSTAEADPTPRTIPARSPTTRSPTCRRRSSTIVDNRGGSPDGTDILTGVEFLRFSDGLAPVVFPNFVPVITSNGGLAIASINVAENTTAVTTVTATDPDLDTPTFSLVGGADLARFSIDATTGALAFVAAPDFENPTDVGANNTYDVVVRASDGNGGQDDQAITVTVTDVADTRRPTTSSRWPRTARTPERCRTPT